MGSSCSWKERESICSSCFYGNCFRSFLLLDYTRYETKSCRLRLFWKRDRELKTSICTIRFTLFNPNYQQILTKNISYATWKVSKEVLIEEYEKEENKRRQEAAEEAARLAAEELAKQQQQQSEQTEQTDSSDHSNQSESSETTNTTTNTTKSSGLVAVQESSSSETDNTENNASPSLMIVEDKKKENDSFQISMGFYCLLIERNVLYKILYDRKQLRSRLSISHQTDFPSFSYFLINFYIIRFSIL